MRQRYNDGWEFLKLPYDTDMEEMRRHIQEFYPVDIPHDWLIYNTADLYESSIGWYRKQTVISKKQGEHIFLYFEGIYMDSTVYVNGHKAGEWKCGYSSFEIEITEYLNGKIEEILVCVTHISPNSRWYSGAGVYRDVWLKVTGETWLVSDGVYVSAKKDGEDWVLTAEAETAGSNAVSVSCVFHLKYLGKSIVSIEADKEKELCKKAVMQVASPVLWDVENPVLYELEVVLDNGETETVRFGFREISFSPEQGFFLNGRRLKLNGACEHHDLGCLGAAYSHAAMKRKLDRLKEMGVNAIRTTHNMPAPDVMDLADEMGILVVSEAFDMWELSKTPYDYARFFKEWAEHDVAAWVRRDRNHPSLIMWSIGNEIYDTHAGERGQEVTRMLMKWVEEHDRHKNAFVTIGSNYMPWENARKCADIVKLAGYNYGEKYYEAHHREHPDWVIYGSETASVVQSRGIYHFPLEKRMLSDEDEQCSALGNSSTSWGAASIERCITDDRDAQFSMGQFIWTGFDYIGEPTPYHTKNSYFGQLDTAGFPKDSYYIFQAEWTDYKKAPMVHVFPYWDFNPGQMIDVRVCSNAPQIELFVNGISQGKRYIDHKKDKNPVQDFKIPYEAGELKAVAYDENGKIIAEKYRHSFGDSKKIILKADKKQLLADGLDLLFVEISTEDEKGNPVENAVDYVEVSVTGAGRLIGLDNGDSTDYDSYKGVRRKLFSGKLLAVIAAKCEAGLVEISVRGENLEPAGLRVEAMPCEVKEGISAIVENQAYDCDSEKKTWIRKIVLSSKQGQVITPENPHIEVTADIYPAAAAYKEITWAAVTDGGIASPIATVEEVVLANGEAQASAIVKAKADGGFRLRCMADNGTGKIKLISQLEFKAEGFGRPFLNPYEFISGGLYSRIVGEVGNGNEKGVASARNGVSQIEYADIDFGEFGSDEITIPVFALDDKPHIIELWEGMPDEEGSSKIGDLMYQKPSKWNVYQPETWKLERRLTGVTSLCMVLYDKVHLKGFSFTRQEKAYARLYGAQTSQIYGDSFIKAAQYVESIGNNVTLEFDQMDFGEIGTEKVSIYGRTPIPHNTIHIRFEQDGETENQIVEFAASGEYECQTFSLKPVYGKKKVLFVFLPGSNFDFGWFEFHKK